MSYYKFLTSHLVFGGVQKPFKEANYVIIGVPFDSTATYRSGARFAPDAIRSASLNLETHSFRANCDFEDIAIHDLGNLHTTFNSEETLKNLEHVTKDLLKAEKTPIYIGGEHTITLGAMRGVGEKVALVSFDAHLDLRDEYLGQTLSHTTFMRRINEQICPEKILEIGIRAVCKEELDYVKEAGILFYTVQQIRRNGYLRTVKEIKETLSDSEKVYLTIDMDVLDPAFVPAVQNPEPDGLSIQIFLDILGELCDHRIIAFDIVEVAPHYDQGVSAFCAAKALFEVLCHITRSKKAE
jgi:agmatinase